MPQIGSLIVLCVTLLCSGAKATSATATPYAEPLPFIKDLRARGLDIGGGLSVHLDTVPAQANASIFARHALRFDYNGMGMRLGIDNEDEAYKVGLYYGEGRGEHKNKVSELIIPALLGYKTSALIVMVLFGVTVIVVKALTVANIAILTAAALWAKKLFGGGSSHRYHHTPIELDHHPSELHPVYAEYPGDISELGYAQTAAGNYIAYAAPLQEGTESDVGGAGAATSQQYSFVEAPANMIANATNARRRESAISRPQSLHTYITVRRKSVLQ